MSDEIERKFLVPGPPPDLADAPSAAIDQGYLAVAQDGTEVRVRRRGDHTVLTVKGGGGRRRVEEEFAIDADVFDRLWPLTEGRRVQKRRHDLPHDGLTIEVDVYAGDLHGLVVAEVEFASDEDADAFVPPTWFGREVTDDPSYKNRSLASDGLPAG